MKLTLASLFDGSGTAPLAASMCGITPVWASEIEPYPIRVTTKRFPNMKHYGSITNIDGGKADPVDIICGGSPCQDLSVAGKQAGLDGGTRSHLFYEMVRIIKEMRKATDGKKPRYIVWENVPGAFSSNNGYDFMSVLQSFAEIAEADVHVPEPERKANKLVWRYAGEMVGRGWSIAWRTVDAQYWGVPQRRRRIYLVVDLDSERAGEILFERESVRGYFAEDGTERQGTSTDAERSTGTDDRERKCYGIVSKGNGEARPIQEYKSATLAINTNQYLFQPMSLKEENWAESIVKNAIRAGESKTSHAVVEVYDARGSGDGKTVNTLTGDHKKRITDYTSIVCEPLPIHDQATRYAGKRGDKADGKGNGLGVGNPGDPMNTLTSADRHAVVYATDIGFLNSLENVSPTLLARMYKDPHLITYKGSEIYYIVRRLTPLECSRLQGFPDCWELDLETPNPTEEDIAFWTEVFETHRKVVSPDVKPKTRNQIIRWLKDPYSDSASYKMWGNGMALPNMLFVVSRIKEAHQSV